MKTLLTRFLVIGFAGHIRLLLFPQMANQNSLTPFNSPSPAFIKPGVKEEHGQTSPGSPTSGKLESEPGGRESHPLWEMDGHPLGCT